MRTLLPTLLVLASLGGTAFLLAEDGPSARLRVGPGSLRLDLGVSSAAQPAAGPEEAGDPRVPAAGLSRPASRPTLRDAVRVHQGDGLAAWNLPARSGRERELGKAFLRRLLLPGTTSGEPSGPSGAVSGSPADVLERILELEADLDRVRLAVLGRGIEVS